MNASLKTDSSTDFSSKNIFAKTSSNGKNFVSSTARKTGITVEPSKPKKLLPDFIPKAQDWDNAPNPVASSNMYTLWDSSRQNLDQAARDASVPILAMTGTLREEIRYITHALPNSEYAIFLALRRIDENRPHFLAYDFFIPLQTASGGGVSLDPKDCQRHFNKLKEHEYYKKYGCHRHLCHLHSHAGMPVFWSGTDNTQQLTRDDLGFMDDFRFYCVVNTKDEIKCSLVIYRPALVRIDGIVAVSYGSSGHALELTRKRRKELDGMIEAAISHPVSILSSTKSAESEFGEVKKAGAPDGRGAVRKTGYGNVWARGRGENTQDTGKNRGGSWFHNWENYDWPDNAYPEQEKKVCPARLFDSIDQPLRLDWFSKLDTYEGKTEIPPQMARFFLEEANIAIDQELRACKVLEWLVDQTGVCIDEDGYSPEDVGELFGQYVLEFMTAVRMKGDYAGELYRLLSEDTQNAILECNREEAKKCMVDDLIDLVTVNCQ